MPPVSVVPPHTSGSHLRSKDKGKAPLEEYDVEESDEDEDEMPLQRKRGASVLSTRDADFDSVPGDGILSFLGPFLFWYGLLFCLS